MRNIHWSALGWVEFLTVVEEKISALSLGCPMGFVAVCVVDRNPLHVVIDIITLVNDPKKLKLCTFFEWSIISKLRSIMK